MTARAPLNVVRRAIGVLRAEGWRVFWLKLAGECGYRRVVLLECLLADAPPPAAATPALHCALLDEGAIDDYLALRPDVGRAEVLARMREGCVCFVARSNARVVAACWARLRGARSDWVEYTVPLEGGDAYLFDAYTAEAARGQGIAAALARFQLRYLRDTGCRRALRGTLPENTSALRAHRKSGFHPIAMVTRVRVGPWRRTRRRPWPG